jgi:phosphatidylinositol alpha-1,6-mannosyltransferase
MLAAHWRGRIDWVMYDHLGPARVQAVIPSSLARPYAVFLHSLEVWTHLSESRKRILREAKVRIANSNYTAQRVLAAHPDIGPIEVCHLALAPPSISDLLPIDSHDRESGPGLDVVSSKSEATATELLSRINAQAVLIVGRMMSDEGHKGHDQLIEIWSQVTGAAPDAQLVIVGPGDDVSRLKDKASQAGLGESIIFTGHVSDSTLQELYRRAAVFCMPSSGEGFGLVYLEAMRHRLPCIASPDNAAVEVVLDGETGLLASQSDPNRLASAIIQLLNNPALRRQMGEAGRARLQNVFSFENFEQRLLRILENASLLKPNKS